MNITDLNFPHLPQAACNPMTADLFWRGTGEAPTDAIALCNLCPEKAPCLQWSLDNNETFGVWGGVNAEDRARLLRRTTRKKKVRVCLDCPTVIKPPKQRCEECRPAAAERARERELARKRAA